MISGKNTGAVNVHLSSNSRSKEGGITNKRRCTWVCLLLVGGLLQKRLRLFITLLFVRKNDNSGFRMYKFMFGSLKLVFRACCFLWFLFELLSFKICCPNKNIGI